MDGEGGEGDMGLVLPASSRTRVVGGLGTCSKGLLAATVAVTEVWLVAAVVVVVLAVWLCVVVAGR